MAMATGGVMLAGCAQPERPWLRRAGAEVVWPAPPEPARVRLIGEIGQEAAFRTAASRPTALEVLLFGEPEPWRLVSPQDVAVHDDGERVAIADTNGPCIHVVHLGNREYERIASAGSPPVPLQCPVGVVWAGEALYGVDSQLGAIVRWEAGRGAELLARGAVGRPADITWCPQAQRLYVTDAAGHRVMMFRRNGEMVGQFGQRGSGEGEFNYPTSITCGPDGVLVVADSLNFRVQRFAPDGTYLGGFGRKGDAAGDFALPKGVAVAANGSIWVVDAHFENVQAFTPEGRLLLVIGEEGQGPGQFWLPAGVCIDRKGRMWVADTYNRRVQVFALTDVGGGDEA